MNARSIALRSLAPPRHALRSVLQTNAENYLPRRRRTPVISYIICTNPRSGSWLLSDGLTSTGVAGRPREWFNILEEQQHRARWRMEHSTDLPFSVYMNQVRAESTTRNGVSGTKLHYYQFAELPKKVDTIDDLRGLTPDRIVAKLYPNATYIWLTRREKARQAISFFLAARTDRWWEIGGIAPRKSKGETPLPEFDPRVIARREQILIANDMSWRQYFTKNEIDPLVIQYESLADDYEGTIRSVLKWLGVAADSDSAPIRPARLKRQSNEISEDWLDRYEAFKRDTDLSAPVGGREKDGSSEAELIAKALKVIPDAWKEWIAHSKLTKMEDETIVDVLAGNGYERASAEAEVNAASAHPYVTGSARSCARHGKAVDLLSIQGQLARLGIRAVTIERVACVGREEFLDRYYRRNRPVILQQLMTEWAAPALWTPEHLTNLAGEETVEVMTGRNADSLCDGNPDRHRTNIKFADFIDMLYSGKATNDYCITPENDFLRTTAAKPLLNDFYAFPEYLEPDASSAGSSLWFRPTGSVTRLHHDFCNILHAQVKGRNLYRLVPPSQWDCVYNSAGNFADVDAARPDWTRHPKFSNACVTEVVLLPGETLFLPVGWWSYVRALDVSLTISFSNFRFPNQYEWR